MDFSWGVLSISGLGPSRFFLESLGSPDPPNGSHMFAKCLQFFPDASQMLPRCSHDASQVPLRCQRGSRRHSDVFQMPPNVSQPLSRCFPEGCKRLPVAPGMPRSPQTPPKCLLDASRCAWVLLRVFQCASKMLPRRLSDVHECRQLHPNSLE